MLRALEKHAGLAVFTGYAAKLGKGPVARGRKRTVLRRVWPSPSGRRLHIILAPAAGDTATRCVTGRSIATHVSTPPARLRVRTAVIARRSCRHGAERVLRRPHAIGVFHTYYWRHVRERSRTSRPLFVRVVLPCFAA